MLYVPEKVHKSFEWDLQWELMARVFGKHGSEEGVEVQQPIVGKHKSLEAHVTLKIRSIQFEQGSSSGL
jgi:hypothetical protein